MLRFFYELVLGVIAFLMPLAASAHFSHFVPTESIIANEELGFSFYDPIVLVCLFVVFVIFGFAILGEKYLPVFRKFNRFGRLYRKYIVLLFKVIILVSLGFHIYCGIFYFLGSLYFLGVIFYLFSGKDLKKWNLPVLRSSTGLTFVVLAFSDKLLHPELGLEFLRQNEIIFSSFEWFSSYEFIVALGAFELLIGLLFIFGLMTRISSVFAILFVVLDAYWFGLSEFVLHLPMLAVLVLLFFYGSGRELKLFS